MSEPPFKGPSTVIFHLFSRKMLQSSLLIFSISCHFFYWRLTTLLSCLTEKDGGNNGLYQDNGLSAFNEKPQEIENIRRELCKIFWDNNLKITVKANIAKVNFLYVTLGLKAGKPYPCNKGNILLYVHKRSVTVCQNLMTNIALILCETMETIHTFLFLLILEVVQLYKMIVL